MTIIKVSENLYNIILKLNLDGSDFFLSPWVYNDNNLSFIVDPGPTSTIKVLKKELNNLNITDKNLDFILLTHIHMDHAGGAGSLLNYYSKAKVICHPKGIKHLINPEALWKGSKKVLGKVANLYGEIRSIPPDRILYQEKIADNKIKAIETLGHAPHHLSFLFQKYLFAGEAAGVSYPLPNQIYIRPATPPIFNYNISINTLDNLISLKLLDYMICYAHHGVRENADLMLRLAREQIILWTKVIQSNIQKRNKSESISYIIDKLKKKDQYFSNISFLKDDVRKREIFFVNNSIKGITEYILNSTIN
ncbi:MAG: MBL fold metallo-hydrolase [Promethearchaeota archaeon]